MSRWMGAVTVGLGRASPGCCRTVQATPLRSSVRSVLAMRCCRTYFDLAMVDGERARSPSATLMAGHGAERVAAWRGQLL